MPRNIPRPANYVDDESWDSQKSGRDIESQFARVSPDRDEADEETEDSCSEEMYDSYCEETEDSSGDDSIVVPDHVVEYAETASPRTPSESSVQSSATFHRVRKSRRRRSSRYMIRSGSESAPFSSPCSRLGSLGGRQVMSQDHSLVNRLERAILTLDQLKSYLQGVKMEAARGDEEYNGH
ncbi:hypothetical protein CEP51_015120 [Fusarium floridanum]|uniref:Uncharacterized protein n=1 Tax=Fusarium floridanum TaxID=1325733 RepID=A0A428PG52_9HYPO|nr:hypothetical protein CEP51_015120 [Fusarium floridanum]